MNSNTREVPRQIAYRLGAPLIVIALFSSYLGLQVGSWQVIAAAVVASALTHVLSPCVFEPWLTRRGFLRGTDVRFMLLAAANAAVALASCLAILPY